MSEIVKGMARVHWRSWLESETATPVPVTPDDMKAMRRANLWLAERLEADDPMTDEMAAAYINAPVKNCKNLSMTIKKSIAAAIRAAAGGEG
jgi:hypothetical protein